jgi:2-polyprenyl-3-methyl-5-hydroxy-6-metoxy-1,4-benzoquinol methylase
MSTSKPVMTDAPCSVCGGRARTVYDDLYDDRYGYPDLFAIRKCEACGHLHTEAHFTPDDLMRLYTRYYPRGNFALESFEPAKEGRGLLSWLNGEHAAAFRWIPPNVRVLDIGCGVGATLAYHRSRGCEAVGIEADENVQPIADRFGLDIRKGVFDGTQFEPDYFDYVTLDQVAEHVVDPLAFMRGVARVLKPGGSVILTTPNPRGLGVRLYGRKWVNWHVPYHLQFYTHRSMDIAARQAGLSVVQCRTLAVSQWQLFQWLHAITFPKRGEKSQFWVYGEVPVSKYSFGRILYALARRFHIQRGIARLLDMTGLGDNFVFVLRKDPVAKA